MSKTSAFYWTVSGQNIVRRNKLWLFVLRPLSAKYPSFQIFEAVYGKFSGRVPIKKIFAVNMPEWQIWEFIVFVIRALDMPFAGYAMNQNCSKTKLYETTYRKLGKSYSALSHTLLHSTFSRQNLKRLIYKIDTFYNIYLSVYYFGTIHFFFGVFLILFNDK